MDYMKKEYLGSDQKYQRWDFYDFPFAGKPSNIMMLVPNIVTLLLNFQQCLDVGVERHDFIHQNPKNVTML